MNPPVDTPHRALNFWVAGMADQDDLTTLVGISLSFDVHFRDQRAGRIDNRQATLVGALLDRAGHPMRAEDGYCTGRNLVDLVDETSSLGAQPFDHMPVVHNFMTHIDRRAVLFQRALDD